MSNLKIRAAIILVVIAACVYGIIGFPTSKDQLVKNLNDNIKLGLDLRGGSMLIAEIQVQDAFKVYADQTMDRLRQDLQKAGVDFQSAEGEYAASLADADKTRILIKGVNVNKAGALRSVIAEKYDASWVLTPVNSTDYSLTMKPTAALQLRKDTVERAKQTIENRINGLGLAEATVQQRGQAETSSEILVQLPGVDDPARVKSLIQTAAMLEITSVLGGPFPSEQAARGSNSGVLPVNSKVVKLAGRSDRSEEYYIVSRSPVVTGQDVRNARPGRDSLTGRFETEFTLSPEAGQRFKRFTGENIGKPLAIVLDNVARSVANIENAIEMNGRITGAPSEQDAADLALVLRSGSLPAGVNYSQEQTVGPSLGADSIKAGFTAGAVGLVAVVSFMLFYYKRSGVNATLALILNAVILIACLSYFGAVLTLPGIAGIILTIGMAVDSNVLIFERIREELRNGKSVLAAIDQGFSKAFLTIIDTHVTTVVSCAFLFIFGSPQVKGFAVTLVIGLIANVFTAVFVSRVIFDAETVGKKQLVDLSI